MTKLPLLACKTSYSDFSSPSTARLRASLRLARSASSSFCTRSHSSLDLVFVASVGDLLLASPEDEIVPDETNRDISQVILLIRGERAVRAGSI